MIITNYVLVFVFVSITAGFKTDFQNEAKIKSPFFRAINRIRRSEDSNGVESEGYGKDMVVEESRFIPHSFHSFLPFPPPHYGHFPGEYPHLGQHQNMLGNSNWNNENAFMEDRYGYNPHHNHQHGFGNGHKHGFGHGHGHGFGHEHGFGHGHGHEHGQGYGCGHDLNNEFHHHHEKNDKSTTPSIISTVEVTTPPTTSTSVIYDIDVRLGS